MVGTSSNTIKPERISIAQLRILKNKTVKPIDNVIPNVTMPPHLLVKKRATETEDTLSTNIRQLFNSLTTDNIARVRENLRNVVCTKAQKIELLEEVAKEMLENFIIDEKNIPNYMHLLNAVWNASIWIQGPGSEKVISPSIGNYFLTKCKHMIHNFISEENIKKLAEIGVQDMNDDQLDFYNRERDKIINLIATICQLYKQRNTAFLKLTAMQLYPLITNILDSYEQCQRKMRELGNPYENEECEDENEFEICKKMCSLYAEQLYAFMFRLGKDFKNDPTQIKGQTMLHSIERFKNEVIPTLSEEYLRINCESLNFDDDNNCNKNNNKFDKNNNSYF